MEHARPTRRSPWPDRSTKSYLVGNLGRDPESKTFGNGGKVVKFSLATSETWNDRASGERKEKTEWHNVVIYDEKIGEVAERYLRKGAKVYIEGADAIREYDRTPTAPRQKIAEVVLQRFRGAMAMLEGRNTGGGGGDYQGGGDGGSYEGGGSSRPQSRPQPAAFDTDLDDDVPF